MYSEGHPTVEPSKTVITTEVQALVLANIFSQERMYEHPCVASKMPACACVCGNVPAVKNSTRALNPSLSTRGARLCARTGVPTIHAAAATVKAHTAMARAMILNGSHEEHAQARY